MINYALELLLCICVLRHWIDFIKTMRYTLRRRRKILNPQLTFRKFPKGFLLAVQQKISPHYVFNILDAADVPLLPVQMWCYMDSNLF